MLNLLLISDPMFRALNIPLSPEDRKELDRKIKRGEPVDPVISWKGYILTGYEQDDIFLKYRKSSAAVTKEMYFPRRSDAVAWLCHQQLKRTDLIWTAKAWLISKLYEALRDIASRRAAGEEFQYRMLSPSQSSHVPTKPFRESTAILNQLGEEYHYHKETIRRYVRFGRQLDKLEEKVAGIRVRILTGDLIVQMVHMPALTKIPAERLAVLIHDRRTRHLIPPPEYISRAPERKHRQKSNIKVEPGIKQMPKFDPDAELNGLRYTIGAWRKAISRTAEQANFDRATEAGKEDLKQAITKLILEAQTLCRMLEGKHDD